MIFIRRNIFLYVTILFLFQPAMAETLTYDGVLKQAINNSFDLKISNLDIAISKADLKAEKADLFPILSIQANTEYNNGLGNTMNNVGYVGGTVITSQTQFRNMGSLGLQYNLFDFGARGKKILISEKDLAQKEVMYDLQLKDLKLKILSLYTKSLQYSEDLKLKSEILSVYEEIFNAKERLFKAGLNDKISIMDEAINLARTQDNIKLAQLELKNCLNDLSTYTLQNYETENIEISDFNQMNLLQNDNGDTTQNLQLQQFKFDSKFSLEAKYYDFELEKKKAELEAYKRQRYPSFKLYSSYLLYGQDPDRYFSSLGDLKQSSFTVGVSATYYLFDGFKNKAYRQKAHLEMEKIKLERDKKLAQLQSDFKKTHFSYETYKEELNLKQKMLTTVNEKLNDINRLYDKGFKEQTEILNTKVELLTQEAELRKNIIDLTSKIKELEIMGETKI